MILMTTSILYSKCMHLWAFDFSHVDELRLLLCQGFDKFLIQVDIGGHPPSPTGPKHVSGNFGNLLFLAVFNFRGHFEALNDVF
jgi:hypothetical protein